MRLRFSAVFGPNEIIGKKDSLRLFDIFERNMVFIFLLESCGSPRPIGASNEIDKVSKFDNSHSFGAKQSFLR